MHVRTVLRLPVAALTLLFPTASNADEFAVDFVDDTVSRCVDWLDTGELTTFDNEWLLSKESARKLEFAEKYPELAPSSLHFYSPSLSYLAILNSHISQCSVADNFMGVDETGVVASPAVDFDFHSARTALYEWGSEQAGNIGFIDWPEGAERKLLNQRKDFIFFKKHCSGDVLTTIQATAETERTLVNGLPFTAWNITVSRHSASDEIFAEHVLRACPQTS